MDIDTPTRPDRAVKAEDDGHDSRMADSKPSYRSWKKKYRKMRVIFEGKMREGENLYKLEQKALETANRLAVENDRLLDLLLDVNNCPQIPPDKRIDLGLDLPASKDDFRLPIDRPTTPPQHGTTSYKQLLADVPHFGFASASGRLPELVISDLNTGRDSPADPQQGAPHPPTFLTADDVDNYLYHTDVRLAARSAARSGSESPPPLLPTLAPLAGTAGQPPGRGIHPTALLLNLEAALSTGHSSAGGPSAVSGSGTGGGGGAASSSSAVRDLALRNPTSVYNWLRKHAPKTFLQDHEVAASSAADHAVSEEQPNNSHGASTSGRGAAGSRASRGGAHAERGERGSARGGSSARGKKTPGGSSSRKAKDVDAAATAMDLDDDEDDNAHANHTLELATPSAGDGGRKSAGGGAAKRKRLADDDPGYRPKGGSSRPRAKKPRKSAAAAAASEPSASATATPVPAAKAQRGPRKSVAAAAAEPAEDRAARLRREREERGRRKGEKEREKGKGEKGAAAAAAAREEVDVEVEEDEDEDEDEERGEAITARVGDED